MNKHASLPTKLMLGIAVAQGLLLFCLNKAFDNDLWPSESPAWSYPLWTLAIAVPLFLLLSLERGNEIRVARMASGVCVVLALLAAYIGWQAEPFGEFPLYDLSWVFTVTIALACFKALMYFQQRASRQPMSYTVLFSYSWRNFLVPTLASLFVFIFWLILLLWGLLFKIIGIEVFDDLFEKDWFLFPVLGFAFGGGVLMFRNLANVIDNITNLLRGLMQFLLPLVVVVSVIFLLALPFTGLEILWSTGYGTTLLLWLIAGLLFFANAVYQDGSGCDPYPPILHRMIYIGLCALPILSVLSIYGLLLRINQYGWSVDRCWAFVVWLLLTLFAVGYVIGIIRRRDKWPQALAQVNTIMGLVVLAIMLLANSPLLDFRKISLRSQLARVDSGQIELADFDFWNANYSLARPGYLALEQMKQEYGQNNPDLLERIEHPVNPYAVRLQQNVEQLWDEMIYRPTEFPVPVELKALIDRRTYGANGRNLLIKIDLDNNGQDDFVRIRISNNKYIEGSHLYHMTADGWQGRYLFVNPSTVEDLEAALLEGEIKLVEPEFQDLSIGGIRLEIR